MLLAIKDDEQGIFVYSDIEATVNGQKVRGKDISLALQCVGIIYQMRALSYFMC